MNDLISRQEAIALIRAESDISMQNWKEYDDECSYGEMCAHDRDVDILQSLPSGEQTLCITCRYRNKEWDEEPCDSCTMGGESNHYKPSAQPMRKRGKWIDMGDFEQCSACTGTHLKEVNTVYGKAIWIKSPFCPNCGADMRGEGDEVD